MLVKIFSSSVRTLISGRMEMTAKNYVEFYVSEHVWKVCEKKLQNLCWAACCCSAAAYDAFIQAVVRKAVSQLKMSLNGLLWAKDANNNPYVSSHCFLGRAKSRDVESVSC